ncbi:MULTISPECIES: carbohydrate ABC transporter permease [Paenibacillus]|uniref:Carbohydrate ABC transporter membrane protein 1, CUT1 family (TC 3.A.1.1.-) n=1 Tax=Paenibacillus barengoltzii J12 TaxID=935846 RepID=A0ABY1LTP5_9BACL|nr:MULTISPECIES: sugar ABC transporter permease [Paenibacillus]MDU0329641.1 sugar ABC transporter permease [Paenibacillus sp. 3LSP]SMF01093.1 carbohydrate ABC transporter membrane protein 1, CUT1 family (TC 3.A.1.1.-) [Paenibacillus barengoltzii J12]
MQNEPVLGTKAVKRSALSKNVKDHLVAYSFIAPNFIGFAVFTLVPMVYAFVLAFVKWDGANPMEYVGLRNFSRLLQDSTFHKAFWNTIIYTIGVVPLTMVCALALAILLNQKLFGRNFMRTVFFFPYVASLVAVAAVWNFVFSPTMGPVNNLLHSITGIPIEDLPRWAADKDWAMFTVILFTVWKNMGYYMVIYLAGLQGVNPELYEAAELDGAGPWKRFTNVTIPQLAPTTFFVLMILIINSFKVYDIFINLFAGADNQLNNSTRVLVYQIYNTAFRSLDYGYASAMAIVLFLLVLGITLIQFQGEKKYGQ